MGVVALADFGSTYTKVNLVDRAEGRLLARAQAPTTIATDLMEGYAIALAAATEQLPAPVALEAEIAASSAGGGLRIAAIGLVADLTAAAAEQAALNAGARVGTVLSGRLGAPELERLHRAEAEIVLFAGGTDGGQGRLVLENARRLAEDGVDAYVVVACNAEVAEEVVETLVAAGIEAEAAANVMPALGQLRIDGARAAISRVFLEHVIGGKKLSAGPEFARMVRMPTPEAVLSAVSLLSRGDGGEGWGDAIVIDIGGATTDVHSDRAVEKAAPGIEAPLLPTPLTLRTVEGDLGLRAGAPGVVAADRRWLQRQIGGAGGEQAWRGATMRSRRPAWIPADEEEARLDRLLAIGCATHALDRHCGTMLLTRAEAGPPTLVRDGPDLREVRLVVGTGGVFAHRDDGAEILEAALARRAPRSLAPREARLAVDRGYVLAAAGLLSASDPQAARKLLERELKKN